MGQEDTSSDRNLKPQQFDDEDADFPEFEFPVGDAADTTVPEQVEDSNGTVLLRAHIDESPKKMPPAIHENGGRVTAQLSEPEATQPEISKHVVAESESKIPNPVPASSAPQRKVLSSNPSFKSLVTLLGEPLKLRRSASMERRDANGELPKDQNGEVVTGNGDSTGSENSKVLLPTPSSKRLSSILSRVSAKVAAAAADPATKPPERVTSAVSVNVLVEKFSAGARAGSPRPAPRNLTSPRRVMADRSRSPTPRHLQESHPVSPRTSISSPRRGAPVERSVSPLPSRSWKDSVFGDMPKDRRPSFSKPGPSTTPPPRFLTPTQAAALKAVANPNSKSLQFTTAFGITTPVKHPTQTATKTTTTVTKPSPTVTKPAGFNFRTDERAERRRDFYSKLEERLKLKEAERRRAEAKALEEKESQLRELRKSLTYKANPVPRFYQEPAPAPAEIRKSAPTRAKSPNFTMPRRRDSCPASTLSEHGRMSPLRYSRTLLRCESLKAPLPKPKLPFRPV